MRASVLRTTLLASAATLLLASSALGADATRIVVTGQIWRFTLPGSGSVFAIAGNETFVFAADGSFISETFNGESVSFNAAAYCSYLGAN